MSWVWAFSDFSVGSSRSEGADDERGESSILEEDDDPGDSVGE